MISLTDVGSQNTRWMRPTVLWTDLLIIFLRPREPLRP